MKQTLSRRESQVVQRIAAGAPRERISEELGLHPNRVKTCLYRAYKKHGVHSENELLQAVQADDGEEVTLP